MNSNNAIASTQLDSIHSMLESGHKSIRMERHTLPLWGITIGLLILFTGDLTRSLYHNNFWKGFTFEAILIGIVLLVVTSIDFRLVKAARAKRDESLTLVQRRLTRMVWLLFAFGFLLNLYSISHLGGGSRVLALYVVLAGIALYSFGMFSETWYRWSGSVLILAGIAILFTLVPGTTQRLLVANVFIIGSPLISLFTAYANTPARNLLLSITWVAAVIAGAALGHQLHYMVSIDPGKVPVTTLSEYQPVAAQGRHIVTLPAGTRVPLHVTIDGDTLAGPVSATLVLNTKKSIDVVMDGDQLTGVYRINNGPWLEKRDALYIRQFIRKAGISNQGKVSLQRKVVLGSERRLGGLIKSE